MSKLISKEQLIIDEYYINGYNGTRAVLKYNPELPNAAAAVKWHKIKSNNNNTSYIGEKQARLKSQTETSTEKILKELLNWLYVDATEFMGLTPSEIKELPAEVRRCIQSFKSTEQFDKHGNHIGTKVEVKLIDKTKAIEMINKHVGFYAQDNDQKANKVNVLNVLKSADPTALNSLLQAMEQHNDKG